MQSRISLALCLSCSLVALNACDDSSEPETSSVTDAAKTAADTATDAADKATSTAEDEATSAPDEAPASTPPADSTSADDRADGEAAMSTYVSSMEDLSNITKGVTDKLGAATATPQAKAAVDRIKEAWAALDQLNPELKQQLISLSENQINTLKTTLENEADRLANDLGLPELADMIREATTTGSPER